jgi:cell wall-associated NlpC family hydrolase
MIPSLFHSSEKQQQLIQVARGWLGTPFHAFANIRGAGVDCVHLCGEIYLEAGVVTNYEFPRYVMGGGDHRHTSQITQWMDHQLALVFRRLPATAELLIGDFLGFTIGRVIHHCGVFLGDRRFIHAMRSYGVIESSIEDTTFSKRLAAVYRPIKR